MSNQVFHFSNTGISSGQRFYLKDDVSGIFVRNLNIDSNFPVIASNLVYNTGNQTISGLKTFNVAPIISGNAFITGVNLNSYATVANLFATGSILDNKINALSGYVTGITGTFGTLPANLYSTGATLDAKINSLSGYVNSRDNLFSGQIASTGSNLYNSIISLSGLFTGYTGSLDANFASDAQLFITGSILDNKINSLSGYVNSQDIIFSGQVFNTGSRLDNKINSLSGYVNSQDNIFSGQIASTGSILDNKINALSGYVSGISAGGSLPNSIVYTTGDQLISGNKTFLDNLIVSGSGIFNALDLNNIDILSLSGVDVAITSGNVILTNPVSAPNLVYNTGNQTIGGIKTLTDTFNVNNNKIINAVSELINRTSNFFISGDSNARMILVNNSSQITGVIVSGNVTGFNTSVIQIGAGKIQITGSGIGIVINSYNNQYKTAGQFASVSLLHTGNNMYIMYGNTAL